MDCWPVVGPGIDPAYLRLTSKYLILEEQRNLHTEDAVSELVSERASTIPSTSVCLCSASSCICAMSFTRLRALIYSMWPFNYLLDFEIDDLPERNRVLVAFQSCIPSTVCSFHSDGKTSWFCYPSVELQVSTKVWILWRVLKCTAQYRPRLIKASKSLGEYPNMLQHTWW